MVAPGGGEGDMRSIVTVLAFSALMQATPEAQELKERARFEGHRKGVVCLAFSPDGKMLASVDRDRALILWDVATGKALHSLQAPSAGPDDPLAFSRDGKTLAHGDVRGGKVVCSDTGTGKEIGTIQVEKGRGRLWSIALSPDGSLLATGISMRVVILWRVKTGAEDKTARLGGDGGNPVKQL